MRRDSKNARALKTLWKYNGFEEVIGESLEESKKTLIGNQRIGAPACRGRKFSNAVAYANVENRKST